MKKTKWKSKYRMFVMGKGWISDIDRRQKLGGRRYSFYNTEKPEHAMLLNVEEVFDSMLECKNDWNNWTYYVFPEKEWVEEFEQYKKENAERIKEIKDYEKNLTNSKININNMLKPKKEIKKVKWAMLSREFGHLGLFASKVEIYYTLTTDIWRMSSPVVGMKKSKNGKYIFETWNSYYEVDEIKNLGYTNELKEIEGYLKSPYYKAFMKSLKNSVKNDYEKIKKQSTVKLEKREEKGIFDEI